MSISKNSENLLNKSGLIQTKYLHELGLALLNLEEKYKSKNPEYFRDIIHEEAEYIFTDGIYKGREEILKAFAETWEYIKDEIYLIKDVKWLFVSDEVGVCSYRFEWTGNVEGSQKSGQGNATNIFIKNSQGVWQIIHEHLSKID